MSHNKAMIQKQIKPGSILKLPSGNVVRAGATLKNVVRCQYISTENFAELVDLSDRFLNRFASVQ